MSEGMEGGAAVETGAATGAEGAVPAESAGTGAATGAEGAGAAPRTFTQEEVNKIVSERVKGWNSFGKPEELQTRLARLTELEKFHERLGTTLGERPGSARAAAKGPELSAEDKQVLSYLERLSPGFSQWQQQQQQIMAAVNGLARSSWENVNNANMQYFTENAVKHGYPAEMANELAQRVAESIRGNPTDHKAYLQTGARQIIDKHFQAIDGWLKKMGANPQTGAGAGAAGAGTGTGAAAQEYARAKAATAKLPPTPGRGSAPAAQPPDVSKMSDKDFLKAAWSSFTGKST